ncbi:hypothetical protein E2C01_015164 [Portunus trituberculatus]|uniref:Uncharacterized protein n=1 Tax=Portunus trituberculatus TaxID=210409 RepID=A0A5B7DLZ6_PORTR|nr:hypothetical protein [Portunus trituberculatus]
MKVRAILLEAAITCRENLWSVCTLLFTGQVTWELHISHNLPAYSGLEVLEILNVIVMKSSPFLAEPSVIRPTFLHYCRPTISYHKKSHLLF